MGREGVELRYKVRGRGGMEGGEGRNDMLQITA